MFSNIQISGSRYNMQKYMNPNVFKIFQVSFGLLGSPPALLSNPSNHSTNSFNPSLTPITPPVSPCSPLPPPPMLQDGAQQGTTSDLLMDTGNVVKKDLVVRFTEQQKAVQHVTSTMASKHSDYQNPAYNSGGK